MLSPALTLSLPAVILPHTCLVAIASLPVSRFPNKLAPKVPNNIPRNPPFYYFSSFSIAYPTPFINKPDSSRDLTIFMISFISSLKIINVVEREDKSVRRPDLNIFYE